MRIKIWGARGSIPTPQRPDEVKEKIVRALLGVANLPDGELKDELIAAIVEGSQSVGNASDVLQDNRRRVIESYLNQLSPLLAGSGSGNTPCLEIQSGDDVIIIDAGTGIRELGLELMNGDCGRGQGIIHLLFSHPHWDHIQGFPFFRPAFVPGNKIFIYSVHNIEAVLRRQQEFINFPISLERMQADLTFIRLQPDAAFEVGNVKISCLRNRHPGDSYAFRLEQGNRALVYASDASFPADFNPRPHLDFFAGADLLVFDAQFTQRESDEKEDWGHSSSFMGVEMAQQAGVKQLLLFHYDPTYSDSDLQDILQTTRKFQKNQYPQQKPVKINMAREGQVFNLSVNYQTRLNAIPGSDAATLAFSGAFTEKIVGELKEQLAKIQQEHHTTHLIIDMAGVEMLPMSGLRALVKLSKKRPDTPIILAGPTAAVRHTIDLAGYGSLFTMYPSLHSAVSTLQARQALDLTGQTLKGRYKIEGKIGDGRLGTVFKATDIRLNRPVAVKVLSPFFSEGAIAQFLQQGRQIVNLAHPNIINVYECDQDQGLAFMVEEFVEARTLRHLLNQHPNRPLPFYTALNIAAAITAALEYAHAKGVIHGDLKPKNVLLANQPRISDFGLGRLESGKSPLLVDLPLSLITAEYLAPEQILGHPIDARTDLYTLGVILYEMFTGQIPFSGTELEIMAQHRGSHPTPPQELNPTLSYAAEHLILKLLDKDPNRRYASARKTRSILDSMTAPISGDIETAGALPDDPLLAGRQKTLQQLQNLWERTQNGQGQVVLISGGTGLGKTRLAQALARQINQATLLIGRHPQQEHGRAYHPLIDALENYFANTMLEPAQTPVGQLLAHSRRYLPEVWRAVPKIFSNLPPPEALKTDAAPAEVLKQITHTRPWLIILLDLHHSDHSTLTVFQYLAQACATMKLMVVGTVNDTQAENNLILDSTLTRLKRYSHCTTLTLEPLTPEFTADLLHHIWLQQPPPELVETIFRRSQGNPLFIEEIAQTLTDENTVTWRDNRWHFAPVMEADLPHSPGDAILRRVQRLPQETRLMLSQAAILGASFTFADLHEMSALSGADPMDSLDIALERQLLHQAPGEINVHFNHPQTQQALYQHLSASQRQQMHREAGQALERRHLSNMKAVASQLAHHFLLAGEPEKGLVYSLQAALEAESVYVYQHVAHWYSLALTALNQLGAGPDTDPHKFDLLLTRFDVYAHLGNQPGQAADLAALDALAHSLNKPDKLAAFYHRQARFHRAAAQYDQANTAAQTGLTLARQAKNSQLEAVNLVELAQLASGQGQLRIALNHLNAAKKIFSHLNLFSNQAASLNLLGTVWRLAGRPDYALDLSQQALHLSRQAKHVPTQAACLLGVGLNFFELGQLQPAVDHLQQALTLYRLTGHRRGEAAVLAQLGAVYINLGQAEPARLYLAEAQAINSALNNQPGQAALRQIRSALYRHAGDYAAARAEAANALDVFQRLGLRYESSQSWLQLGLAQERLGDLPKAITAFSYVISIQEELGLKTGALAARAGLARCLLAQGDPVQAHREITICLDALAESPTVGGRYGAHVCLWAAQILSQIGHPDPAQSALRLGHGLLEQQAAEFAEAALKTSFLENVPENRELMKK
jgi:anti-anti-sigma factor